MAARMSLHLLTLPPELRNRSFALTIIQDEPLKPYLAQCTKRPPGAEDANHATGHRVRTPREGKVYEYKAFPERPALAAVSRVVRAEVLPVLYGQSAFLFGLEPRYTTKVGDWCMRAGIEMGYMRHVILKFEMQPLNERYVMACRMDVQGLIEFKLGKEAVEGKEKEKGVVLFRYGSGLAEECTCGSEQSINHGLKHPDMAIGDVLSAARVFESAVLSGFLSGLENGCGPEMWCLSEGVPGVGDRLRRMRDTSNGEDAERVNK